MIAENQLDDLLLVIDWENHGVLNYIAKNAWPTSLDAVDEQAKALLAELWSVEESLLGSLVAEVAEVGGHPTTDGTYEFVSGRFNFARYSHVLSVVAPVMADENARLDALVAQMADGPGKETVARLLSQKESALEAVEETAAAQKEARAEAAEGDGGEAAAETASGDIDWHDADVDIEDRMAAVSSGSKKDKLWAAMAQTDCTACGYDCEGYADAILSGDEGDLTKCVPGEDATADVIKSIMSV